MANVFIVTAHPQRQSFNFALTAQASQHFADLGWVVSTSELNQMGFDPRMGPNDYSPIAADQADSLLKQQAYASQQQLWCDDIRREQDKLIAADWLILQFPIWWGSYPAILKGWIERVCGYGFAYGLAQGQQRPLAGKRVMLSVTSGGAANAAEQQQYLAKVNQMATEVFGYMGMTVLTPFIGHGPASATLEQRQQLLVDYQLHLAALLTEQGLNVELALLS